MLTSTAPSTSNINGRLRCHRHLGLARQSRIAPHNGWNDCVHDPVDQAICLCLLSSSDSRGM
jgi:hypothetical protein